jgi:hypothetical protein
LIKDYSLKLVFILMSIGYLQETVALQTKRVTDNETIEAVISNKELTRIAILHDRIRSSYGLEGMYELKNDPIQGALFIKPVEQQLAPFTLFIGTEKNHNYVLHLTPKEQLGDTLLLKPKISPPSKPLHPNPFNPGKQHG